MAWPTTSKVPVPELPPQAVPQQPVGLPQQPEETPWSRYQPHTAVPLAQASTPSFRPGRSTDFDTRGRRETSMPARFARHIPCRRVEHGMGGGFCSLEVSLMLRDTVLPDRGWSRHSMT
eukprot:g1745.t1